MWSLVAGGTGMAASSSIFDIRDLFCLLHVVRHGTEALGLLYINYPREAAASTCLATISGWVSSIVPRFLHSTAVPMQLPHQCRHCQYSVTVSAGTGVGCGSLNHFTSRPKCMSGSIQGSWYNYSKSDGNFRHVWLRNMTKDDGNFRHVW